MNEQNESERQRLEKKIDELNTHSPHTKKTVFNCGYEIPSNLFEHIAQLKDSDFFTFGLSERTQTGQTKSIFSIGILTFSIGS